MEPEPEPEVEPEPEPGYFTNKLNFSFKISFFFAVCWHDYFFRQYLSYIFTRELARARV